MRCAHGGVAQPASSSARVTVGGQPVTTLGPPWVVIGCPLPPLARCVTATWLTAATRVLVEGRPVLIHTAQAVCAPSGGPLAVHATQARVTAT